MNSVGPKEEEILVAPGPDASASYQDLAEFENQAARAAAVIIEMAQRSSPDRPVALFAKIPKPTALAIGLVLGHLARDTPLPGPHGNIIFANWDQGVKRSRPWCATGDTAK